MRRPTRAVIAAAVGGVLVGAVALSGASALTANDKSCRSGITIPYDNGETVAYEACRFDKLDAAVKKLGAPSPTPDPSDTPTVAKPTVGPTPTDSPAPTVTPTTTTPSPTDEPTSASPTPTPTEPSTTTPPVAGFPTAATTGVSSCPTLTKVNNGDEVAVAKDGQVIENVEYLNPVVMNIRSSNVTVRCVKFNGVGYFGIDNTVNNGSSRNLTIDQVDISCKNQPQVIGMLVGEATVSRVNAHNCDHMLNVGGSHLTIKDSYCHDLTNAEPVHADCIQDTGGSTGTTILHNALYSRDTSDVLLGQEGGDSSNVVVDGNLFSSIGSPPPAYMLYLSGKNTVVKNNVFATKRVNGTGGYTYGYCTDNTGAYDYTWTNNKTTDGATIGGC